MRVKSLEQQPEMALEQGLPNALLVALAKFNFLIKPLDFGFGAFVERFARSLDLTLLLQGQGQMAMRLEQLIVGTKRSEEHTSELQSLMRTSYAVFCLKQTKKLIHHNN